MKWRAGLEMASLAMYLRQIAKLHVAWQAQGFVALRREVVHGSLNAVCLGIADALKLRKCILPGRRETSWQSGQECAVWSAQRGV